MILDNEWLRATMQVVAEQGAHEEEIEKRKEELPVLETWRESSVRSRAEDERRLEEEAAARAEECLTLAAKAQERRQELETLEKEREAASQRRSDEEQLLEHTTAKVKKHGEEPQRPLVASKW